jgi:hypothetical protein
MKSPDCVDQIYDTVSMYVRARVWGLLNLTGNSGQYLVQAQGGGRPS